MSDTKGRESLPAKYQNIKLSGNTSVDGGCGVNVDANPGAVTRHMQENLCPCQKLKITVISGFRTKIAVVAKNRAKITVHCRGFWLPYKNYCRGQLPCNNYRALPWWLATVQSIPWLPITFHPLLLCNTVVAAYRGKRYRDEKSLPRKALKIRAGTLCTNFGGHQL